MSTRDADPPLLRETPFSWQDLIRMVLDHRRELVLANVITVLGALVSVPVPLLMPLLIDEVLLDNPGVVVASVDALVPETWQGPVLYIAAVLLLTLMLRLIGLALGVWQTRELTIISKDVIFRMRQDLLLRLKRVSMAEYETLGSGRVASNLVTDLDAIDQFIGGATAKFLVAVLAILGTAAVLLWIHWQLALFILFLNPVVIYFTTRFGRRVKALKSRENAAFEAFQEALAETLTAIQQIRAANRERHYMARMIDRAREIRDFSASYTWKSDAGTRASTALFMFGVDGFRALSMLAVLFSDLSIGQMFAVFSYLWFMLSPVQDLLSVQYAFHSADAALGRVNALIAIHLEPAWPRRTDPFAGRRTVGIELREVSFAYGEGPLVLDRVSLQIAPGEKVALVGASGGGKTTLVQILIGLYPARSGRVLYDGVPVEEIGLDLVRDHVATVLQHPALFNDTVRSNLTLGRDVPDKALWRALEVSQLRDVVEELPKGLDTPVGRGGIRLSGGQRQRLAVARMALADPRVVILDEATSALDTETEERLHRALSTFLAGRTTIIIAHRLSAVRQADRVLVFEDGRIVEEGRHDELIEGEGLYAALYRRQAR